MAKFQFTPLREGRHLDLESKAYRVHFNSRPSARGDMNGLPGVYPPGIFQFTPLREGRRAYPTTCARVMISIHAPPRGATHVRRVKPGGSPISIHAPPRGATHARHPHPRSLQISIHAPPRGATQPRNRQARCSAHFNSRPSARGD